MQQTVPEAGISGRPARPPVSPGEAPRAKGRAARRKGLRAGAALMALGLAVAAIAGGAPGAASANDGEDYYFPPVTSQEKFERSMLAGPRRDGLDREAFVGAIARAQAESAQTPRFALFAKGDGSRRLIMIGLDDQSFRTLFRARAVLAQLTYGMRATPLFRSQGLEASATFFDALKLLGFTSLTLSDGATWTHRIDFE